MRLISTKPLADAIHVDDVQQFGQNDVLYWYDTIDKKFAESLFADKGFPGHIINDSYTLFQTDWPTIIWCADIWLADHVEIFRDLNPQVLQTDYTVNFVINKKQVNRHLAIKLCEFFDLEKNYTWSGVDRNFDMTEIIQEWTNVKHLDSFVKSFLLSPIVTDPRWVGQRMDVSQCSVQSYGGNLHSWQSGIDRIVGMSAISIITESQKFEKAIHFSEKTAYAVLGQTFPLWIGGYRQADEWKTMGFDVFDDVIDHSYQYRDTLIERCWHAFADNLGILTDKHHADQLRKKHKTRLRHNFDLLVGGQVALSELAKIARWPSDLRKLAMHIINNQFPRLITNHSEQP